MVRRAVAAGRFYPGNSEKLSEQIKAFLSKADVKKQKNYGIIAPHAGYVYSGQTAAYSFSCIQKADTFVMLGTNHLNAKNEISIDNFETPLGIVQNDVEFSRKLLKNSIFSENSQDYEHSIEVQLPFLQYLVKNPRIVPINMATDNIQEIKKMAELIIETSKKLGRKIYIIASSDFIHYGPGYGFMPFPSEDASDKLEKLDREAISFILNLDSSGFLDYVHKTGATICGKGAIAVAIEACRMIGAKKAKLLKFSSSADISGDENAVDYASIVFI